MSYEAQDSSVKGGQPYFLYQFAKGATVTRFTSDPETLTKLGNDWAPSAISHDEIEETGNIERNSLELIFPISDVFAFPYLVPNTKITTLTIFRGHHTDLTDDIQTIWKGRLLGASSSKQTIRMTCENVFTSMRRPGCRVRVQRTCRHALYDANCGALMSNFDHACTITAGSGLGLTVPAGTGFPRGQFTGGMIKWGDEYGMIEYHNGAYILLTVEIPGLIDALAISDQSATLFDGCNRNLESSQGCTHFDKMVNYGGFRWIPNINIFNSSLV